MATGVQKNVPMVESIDEYKGNCIALSYAGHDWQQPELLKSPSIRIATTGEMICSR